MATLAPALGDGFTLAPNQSTPVLQVLAEDVNVDRIRDLMRDPHALHFEQAYYELETEDGLNYAFLEETTRSRTATILIDFGDGEWHKYRFATNVNRAPDGEYLGVRMEDALDLLGVGSATEMQHDISDPNNPIPIHRVLTQVRKEDGAWVPGDPNDLSQYTLWMVYGSNEEFEDPNLDFEDLVLHAGDAAMLVFSQDQDEDGLYDWDENLYGTSDDPDNSSNEDFDEDGLTDYEETSPRPVDDSECDEPPCFEPAGWEVCVRDQAPYRVYSDPRAADADEDGLNDRTERGGCEVGGEYDPTHQTENDCTAAGGTWLGAPTDPNQKDTDGDALPDATDPLPLLPALKLYVKPDAPDADGLTWDTAYRGLDTAIADAQARNSNSDPEDDVAEIWVAAGTYTFTSEQPLLSHVSIYGGFAGDETKLGQRDPEPTSNGTAIIGQAGQEHRAFRFQDKVNTVLDGFTISDWYTPYNAAGAVFVRDSVGVVFRNILFINNSAGAGGAGALLIDAYNDDCEVTLEGCVFSGNVAADDLFGGGALWCDLSIVRIHDCLFLDNRAAESGGAIYSEYCDLRISESRFENNRAGSQDYSSEAFGGAIMNWFGQLQLTNCIFTENWVASQDSGALGGAIFDYSSTRLAFVNCIFWANQAQSMGLVEMVSALYTSSLRAYMTNCSIVGNVTLFLSEFTGPAVAWGGGFLKVENCVIACNGADPSEPGMCGPNVFVSSNDCYFSHTCLYPVQGNFLLGSDDQIVQWFPGGITVEEPGFTMGWDSSGDLHLGEGSPLIDAGSNYVDIDPGTPGIQFLPEIDLDGNYRIVDGDLDGEETVDVGAYEYQGSGGG